MPAGHGGAARTRSVVTKNTWLCDPLVVAEAWEQVWLLCGPFLLHASHSPWGSRGKLPEDWGHVEFAGVFPAPGVVPLSAIKVSPLGRFVSHCGTCYV